VNYCFVGLGNPGKKYEMTRHNLGFLVLKAFAHRHELKFKDVPGFHGYAAKGQVNEKFLYLLMPTTYMNDSGRAVKAFMDYYKLSLSDLIVITDDIALEFGTMRLKPKGSAGGHNGLKSIEACLGSQLYTRLRMGIGNCTDMPLVKHVLETFTEEELKHLPEVVSKGAAALDQLLAAGLGQTMNSINKKMQIMPQNHEEGENKHEH
jgi:peptidyl-tRNA hydrolase, PTH1 family